MLSIGWLLRTIHAYFCSNKIFCSYILIFNFLSVNHPFKIQLYQFLVLILKLDSVFIVQIIQQMSTEESLSATTHSNCEVPMNFGSSWRLLSALCIVCEHICISIHTEQADFSLGRKRHLNLQLCNICHLPYNYTGMQKMFRNRKE